MALKLGTTGMDSATESQVRDAFEAANAQTGGRWTLVAEAAADYVVVDMDSLYGPMSWLKLHNAGRKVVGLTSSSRCNTDYRLQRPMEASALAVLLSEIAAEEAGEAPPARAEAKPAEPAEIAPPQAQAPAGADTPEPAAASAEPEPEPVPVATAAAEPVAPAPATTSQQPRTLAGWVRMHGLTQRVRLDFKDGTLLLIDCAAGTWHGPKELKPLTHCFAAEPGELEVRVLDEAEWQQAASAVGPAQPISRLQWLGGLCSGAQTRGNYRLRKWPQIEREYPRHFRIATVMMKGAASIAEIAQASGTSEDDVRDFVNASLATGYAVGANAGDTSTAPAVSAPAEPTRPTPGSGGLFGRRRR